jgi:hypothetical protein
MALFICEMMVLPALTGFLVRDASDFERGLKASKMVAGFRDGEEACCWCSISSPDLRLCLELDPVDVEGVLAALDGEGLEEPCPTFKCRVCDILHVPANIYPKILLLFAFSILHSV